MARSIRKRVHYPHPPERVWEALTSRESLAAWLMPNDFAPRVGHRFNFRTDPAPGFDGVVHCEVLELETPRRMVWSWRGGQIDTRVTFTLAPVAGGTELLFEQTGFEGVPAILTSFILQGGFGKMFDERLPAVLDRLARGDDVATACERERAGLGALVETITARVAARFRKEGER